MKVVFELTYASRRRLYKGRSFIFRHEKYRKKEKEYEEISVFIKH